MRKLYVPISMDPEHNVDIYNEDFKKLGVSHVFLTEGGRLVHQYGNATILLLKTRESI